jgi:hypothetical protein
VHTITVSPAARLLLSSQVMVSGDPFTAPRLRLHLRTDLEHGVILDLDPEAFRFLASSLRQMLSGYQAAERAIRQPAPSFRSLRPTPRRLPI